ncbi:DUF4238 domain-containing protein [Microbacterium sp. Leaf179]|uniref:DUF4238 domain-containing protein n=1 Tax=Microbacterium sp. Leaf179 TaxID=1736288 RepID=UPI000AADE4EB|nr:DUF4238 domain-containing protein [Microbacterium sp. Leaf179]
MDLSKDHYISRFHMRQWATENRITVLVRGWNEPKQLEVGKKVAAELGLNAPSIEAAYGKVETATSRALRRLLDRSATPTDRDWNAVREYAVLVHDRFRALRGSAANEKGLPGGNAMMMPNPAHWGRTDDSPNPLDRLATVMDREALKAARLQHLPLAARLLPPKMQILHGPPMLLGDAGIHAISLNPDKNRQRTFVAMPLAPGSMIVFGEQLPSDDDASDLHRMLNMKIAMESTVVIDTLEAPIINSFVAEMWKYQVGPSGAGVPQAIRVFNDLNDIPARRGAPSAANA